MNDWWCEIDEEILNRLATEGSMTPIELGRKLGMSEDATTSLLARLAQEGRITILRVAPATVAARP